MLKELREARGLSRKEVSEISGINLRSLQDYEQGHKKLSSAKGETLFHLGRTLGYTIEELLEDYVSEIEFEQRTDEKSAARLMEYWDQTEAVLEMPQRQYYLMHRDEIVAVLTLDTHSGIIVRIGKVFKKELLPPGANLSPEDLKKWWDRRAVPLKQGQMQYLLQENRIPTTQSYLLQNLGMSLSDHYWLNPVNRCYKWDDVNLFTNDFRDDLGNFRFLDSISSENKVMNLQKRTVFFPSASLQGEIQKKWVLQDGKRYLIKANYGSSSQQSINEVIATLLHEKQGRVPFAKYQLCSIEVSGNKEIGCFCEDFCTEAVEFISAYDVINSVKKRNDMSVYEHFIDVCVQNGLCEKEVRDFLEYQILSDFILSNTDRHLYNMGILRDSKTLKYLGMAPIFDSGNALFWDRKKVPAKNELLEISVNSFLGKEVELLKYVKNSDVLDRDKLPKEQEVKELLVLDEDNEKRLDAILEGYRCKIRLLEMLQSGTKIYQYGFHFEE